MKKKLNLHHLEINSFITSGKEIPFETIKGGQRPPAETDIDCNDTETPYTEVNDWCFSGTCDVTQPFVCFTIPAVCP